MSEIQFQFSTSTAWTSGIIRRLTHSDFSHVDIIEPGKGLWGVSGEDKSIKDPGGVRCRQFGAWPYLRPPKVAKCTATDNVIRGIFEWARSTEGSPFDNGALYHFLRDRAGLKPLGRDWRDPRQWFCSEWALRNAEVNGLFAWSLVTPKDTVSPNDVLIHLNPLMTNVEEFL